jgi:hypothetical protein
MRLRSCRSTRFGQVGVDFEQMTKESYTKKQLKGNDDGSDTVTEGERNRVYKVNVLYLSSCLIYKK